MNEMGGEKMLECGSEEGKEESGRKERRDEREGR